MGIYGSKAATPVMYIKTAHEDAAEHPLDEVILCISRVDGDVHVAAGKAKMIFAEGDSANVIARSACVKALARGKRLRVTTNYGYGGTKTYGQENAKELAEAVTDTAKQLKTIKHLALKA